MQLAAAQDDAAGNAAANTTGNPPETPKAEETSSEKTSAEKQPALELNRVEVRGTRRREQPGKTSASGDELRRMPGSAGDPMRAVQSMPGVAVTDDSSSEPAVRGARPSDNAYYADFLPVGYLFHLGGLVSVFHPDLIQRFDLYSAAWSPEYGDVIGGVFDVGLRNPRTDRFGGKLDVSLLNGGLLIEGPVTQDMSFYLAARRSYADLLVREINDEEEGVRVVTPSYYDYQGKFLWNVNPSNRLSLHLNGAADQLEFTVRGDSKLAQQEPVLAGNGSERTSYASLAAKWEADVGEQSLNRFAIGRTQDRASSRVGTAGNVRSTVTETYVREQLRFVPLDDHEVTLGGSLRRFDVAFDADFNNARCTEFDPNCDLTSAPRVRSKQSFSASFADVYLSDRWQFLPSWAAVAGLRQSWDNYLDRAYTEPRAGLDWDVTKRTRVSAAWGRHNQFPAGEQVLREIGNPRLLRLRATHSALGVSQQIGTGWSVRAEGYYKKFDDFVVSDAQSNYANGGSGFSRGLELLVKKEPNTKESNAKESTAKESTTKLSGFFALTLSESKRRNDVTGQQFPFDYDQPIIATLVASYKPSQRWQYGLKWSFRSGAPYTPIVGTGTYADGRVRPIYGEINSQRLPNYHRLDLRVDRMFAKGSSVYFELINAYARKNVAGYSYNANYTQREPVYQLPLLPSFGVQYTF